MQRFKVQGDFQGDLLISLDLRVKLIRFQSSILFDHQSTTSRGALLFYHHVILLRAELDLYPRFYLRQSQYSYKMSFGG
jgi:hypothetical protein